MRLNKYLTPMLCFLGIPAFANPFINLRSAAGTAPAATAKAASPATLPAATAVSAADVIGYWSKTATEDPDFEYTFQLYFESSGSFELRFYSKDLDEEFRGHGYGTWTLTGESVEIALDTKRCLKDEGTGLLPCDEDSEPWTYVIRETLGERTLFATTDGEEIPIADYIGPQKQFTLPVLSRPTAVGPSARDMLFARRRGLSILGKTGSSGTGFDITGRASRHGVATTPRVPLNYYKLK